MFLQNEPSFHLIQKIKTKEKPSTSQRVTISEIFKFIKEGNPQNSSSYYTWLRSLDQKNKEHKKRYDNEKNYKIMSWLPSACFNTKYANKDVQHLTGIQYFDFDFDTVEDAKKYKIVLSQLPFIVGTWISVGGTGIGCLVLVEGLTRNNYKYVYNFLGNHLFNKKYDKACSNPSRKNCLSFDAEIYINENPKPFILTPEILSNIKIKTTPNKESNMKKERTLDTLLGEEITFDDVTNVCLAKRECWPQEIKKLRFLTWNEILPEDCISGQSYAIFNEKITFYGTFNKAFQKGLIIEEGYRTNILFSKCCSMMLNNEKLIIKHGIWCLAPFYKWLVGVNYKTNAEPLDDITLLKMITDIYNLMLNGELYSDYGKEKRIAWMQGNGYSGRQKQRIAGKAIRAMVKNKNRKMIIETFNKIAEEQIGEIPTQKQIAERTKLSVNTIAQYWKELNPKPNIIKMKAVIGYSWKDELEPVIIIERIIDYLKLTEEQKKKVTEVRVHYFYHQNKMIYSRALEMLFQKYIQCLDSDFIDKEILTRPEVCKEVHPIMEELYTLILISPAA